MKAIDTSAFPKNWQLHVTDTYNSGSSMAAEFLLSELRARPDMVLCAATGNSPTLTYELFTRSVLSNKVPHATMRVVKLDEWGGLPTDDPATCEAYLQKLLIQPLKVSADRSIAFQSDSTAPEVECQRVETLLHAHGPIDVCVLGLGINGHIGFNEPADQLTAQCHIAELTEESLSHSMLTATIHRPSHGLTLGLRDILASKTVLLLVFGSAKAPQLERLITGGLSTHFPASFLTLHQRVICICDQSAAAQLPSELID